MHYWTSDLSKSIPASPETHSGTLCHPKQEHRSKTPGGSLMSAERRLSEVFKSFPVPINEKARGRIHTTELLENIIYAFTGAFIQIYAFARIH